MPLRKPFRTRVIGCIMIRLMSFWKRQEISCEGGAISIVDQWLFMNLITVGDFSKLMPINLNQMGTLRAAETTVFDHILD